MQLVIAEARAQGADALITCGGIQSNHARVTAAAGAVLGLKVVLVVNGAPQAVPTANARLDRLFGADIRHVATRDDRAPAMEQAAADLRAAGHRPFIVPLGASTPTGALGFARGVAELAASGVKPDVIVHSSSSGGTQAGLIAGCALFGLRARVLGISADESSAGLRAIVGTLLDGMADRLGARRDTIGGDREIDGRRHAGGGRLRDSDPLVIRRARTAGAQRRHPARSRLHRESHGRAHRGCAVRRARRRSDRALLAHRRSSGVLRVTLTFLGAARTVTGSKYLLDTGSHRMLVDCGLFQGLKELRQRNWHPLPIRASEIHTVVLTHAHLDHSGYLPRLVGQGFRGRIFCTPATADLARIVLADAARLQEEDAERANRKGYTRHRPAMPLFTEEDAVRAMALLQPVGYERPMPVMPGVTVDFLNAGHLLGSAYARVHVEAAGKTILFGGDLGRYSRPVLPDPTPVAEADVLLVESTYGDRLHEPDDDGAQLAEIIRTTAKRGGKVIIPAFALGRVEELLYWIKLLEDRRQIPELPVYVDSPMASEVLVQYRKRANELDDDLAKEGRRSARARDQRALALRDRQAAGRVDHSRVATGAGIK